MNRHFELLEPIFFTPPNQTNRPVGGRRLFKGGGGSGQRDATDEERRLWGAQAASLEQMNAVAMPNLVTGMNNLGTMANETMDGSFARRLRDQAGADASAAMGQGLTGATQKLERYGSTMNPNALAATMSDAALDGAAQKASAMNQANVAAEDTKWNRNAALTGLASGQGAQSISGMGALSGQISANRNQANNMAMQEQQNQGQAVAGLMLGGKMMGMYRDGGKVGRSELCLADGGMSSFRPVSMPKIAPYSFQASSREPESSGGLMDTVGSLAMPVMGAKMAAAGLDKIGISGPKQAIDGASAAVKDWFSGLGKNAAPLGEGITAGAGQGVGAANAGAGIGEGALGSGLTTSAGTGVGAANVGADALGSGLAAGAETAAATGTAASAAASAIPWVGAAVAIGSMLDLWKDGGQVRQDKRLGGAVSGPGSSTSDSIPARLSDGEGVVNARAMGLEHAQARAVVKDWEKSGKNAGALVLALNDKGLEARYGQDAAQANPRYEGGEQALALGGLATALGNGVYRAAPMMHQMDQQKADNEYRAKTLALAQGRDAREAALHDRNIAALDLAKSREAQAMDVIKQYQGAFGAVGRDVAAVESGQMSPGSFVDTHLDTYNQGLPGGQKIFKQEDGSYLLAANGAAKTGQPIDANSAYRLMNSPETLRRGQQQLALQLARIDPSKYLPAFNEAMKSFYERQEKVSDDAEKYRHEISRDEAKNKTALEVARINRAGAASQNTLLLEKYRQEQKEKQEKGDAAVAWWKHKNPDASPEELNAVRYGLTEPKGGYKIDPDKITRALGKRAVDHRGQPITDVNGKETWVKDQEAEDEFYQYLHDNGISDWERGVVQFKAAKKAQQAKAQAAQPPAQKPGFSPWRAGAR